MRILLDTNTYTNLRRGHAEAVERVSDASELLVSTIVLGEILYGFRHGSRTEANEKRLHAFLAMPRVSVVDVTATTADRYGRICTALRRAGKPIPSNDVWIAAHALETGAELLTFDDHFADIEGLACTILNLET